MTDDLTLSTRRRVLALSALAAFLALSAPVAAQPAYPTRTIRVIVPFPAGGTTDLVARLFAQRLGEGLGQSVIVENMGGAGGSVGADAVAKALEAAGETVHRIGSIVAGPRGCTVEGRAGSWGSDDAWAANHDG